MPYENNPNIVDETPGKKFYCVCGESSKKPYCDGSHENSRTSFFHPKTWGKTSDVCGVNRRRSLHDAGESGTRRKVLIVFCSSMNRNQYEKPHKRA